VCAQPEAAEAFAARTNDSNAFRDKCIAEQIQMWDIFSRGLALQRCNPAVVLAARQILGHTRYCFEMEYMRRARMSVTETVAPVNVIRDCSVCLQPVDGVDKRWVLLHDADPDHPEQELHQMCHMCLIAHFAHAAARNSPAKCPICRVLLNPALGAVDEVPTPGPYTEAYSLLSQFAEGKGIVKMRISESRSRFKILLPQQPNCVGAFNGVQKATARTVLTAARQCRGRIGGYLTQFTNVPVHKAKICKSLSYM